jgi:ureidoacrylate peracid hydrolase
MGHIGGQGIIENNQKIIDAARESGCRIVFLKMSYEPDYSNSGGPESPNWYREVGLVMMRKDPKLWGKFVTERGPGTKKFVKTWRSTLEI